MMATVSANRGLMSSASSRTLTMGFIRLPLFLNNSDIDDPFFRWFVSYRLFISFEGGLFTLL